MWINRFGYFSITVAIVFFASVNANQQPTGLALTAEEQLWIKQNPVLRVGVLKTQKPVEYMEEGELKGLTAEYLKYISEETGLKFIPVAYDVTERRVEKLFNNEIDLISLFPRSSMSKKNNQLDPRLVITTPYINVSAIVVTRKYKGNFATVADLKGMTLTIPEINAEFLKNYITSIAPDTEIISGDSGLTMLEQVASGKADAAVASDDCLGPLMYRRFQNSLQVSGSLSDLTIELSMSMRAEQPLLYSIMQKTLSTMPFDYVSSVHKKCFQADNVFKPSVKEITGHYPRQVVFFGLLLMLLLAVIYQTNRLRISAVHKEREKSMFLAVMSHEIRSPIQALIGAIKLLHKTPLNEKQQHFTHIADSGASTMLTLVNNLLDITKLEGGHTTLEYQAVDITALVHKVVDLYQEQARAKHIYLRCIVDKNLPLLLLDETRISQIMHNLIANAVKFTEVGGVNVVVSISASSSEGLGKLFLTVADTGTGISDEEQKTLFQPYSQAMSAHKKAGSGLGLYICRELVKLIQGSIVLNSVVGKGTQIEVFLPVKIAEHVHSVEAVSPELPVADNTVNNLRILVIEDLQANREVLREQIAAFGFTVVVAGSAAEAIKSFKQGVYALILIDCNLPDQDGYSVTRLLRKMEQSANQTPCPIISISAFTDNAHIERCFDAGMDGILSKPISPAKLQDTLELWCGVTLGDVKILSDNHVLNSAEIKDILQQDYLALTAAIADGNTEAALHAVHRIHGAALSIDLPAIAQAAQSLEMVLRAGTAYNSKEGAGALQDLANAIHAL